MIQSVSQPENKNEEPEPNIKRERHQPVEWYLIIFGAH